MPEPKIEKPIVDHLTRTWPAAHAAAVKALEGIGVKTPSAQRWAARNKAALAAREAFVKASVPQVKQVSAHINWSGDAPQVSLRVVTMDGQRFEGSSAPKLASPAAAPTSPTPAEAKAKDTE